MRKFFKRLWQLSPSHSGLSPGSSEKSAGWIHHLAEEINAFFTEDVEDAPVADALNKAIDHPQELVVHLDALRKHYYVRWLR